VPFFSSKTDQDVHENYKFKRILRSGFAAACMYVIHLKEGWDTAVGKLAPVRHTRRSLFRTSSSGQSLPAKKSVLSSTFIHTLVKSQDSKVAHPIWNPQSKRTKVTQMSGRASVRPHIYHRTSFGIMLFWQRSRHQFLSFCFVY